MSSMDILLLNQHTAGFSFTRCIQIALISVPYQKTYRL